MLILAAVAGLFLVGFPLYSLSKEFRPFRLTVHNQSGKSVDVLAIYIRSLNESGIEGVSSLDRLSRKLGSGRKATFKPALEHAGEGTIYVEYRIGGDRQSMKTVVCGYTEYASGFSTLTLKGTEVQLKQRCH
ncbi:hypothetical protein HGI30_14020 [Paenibacillus albicereus]|uniref:Uncharacterized protein n=1 Tax=Paenibacillus albicereus TaxID=2726185 RepID=A0A6H2GYZ6_9BACL|nr:hypothetical protein [Paenibacillus albicereus]QJC52569.1 hypothetical protein HGI30_14020 [Paenibacillus albicereus]